MTRRPATISFWTGRLPHWEVEGGRYFITLHLAGAIPAAGRTKLRRIAEQLGQFKTPHAPDWLRIQRAIFVEMERWLDGARWNPYLQRRDMAEMVADAIEHRHARGDWQMHEYVVMPTHVHLFCEMGVRGLKETMEDFKRWTGHRAGELMGEGRSRGVGDSGRRRPADSDARSRPAGGTYRFWQREWFDHWSRSDEEDERIGIYIRRNPEKAGLVEDYREWSYGSWK